MIVKTKFNRSDIVTIIKKYEEDKWDVRWDILYKNVKIDSVYLDEFRKIMYLINNSWWYEKDVFVNDKKALRECEKRNKELNNIKKKG